MNVFERVREVNTGVRLSDDRIMGAKSRLLEGIEADVVGARKRLARRPMLLVVGAVAGVAAAMAAVMVVSQLSVPAPVVEAEPHPGPAIDPRQPGEVLPHPAPTGGTGITEPFPGTTPEAGQYLSIVNSSESLLYRDARVMIFQWIGHGEYAPIGALLVRDRSELYVPADRTGDWISRYGQPERVQYFPEDQGPAGVLAWDNMLPPPPETHETVSPGGIGWDFAEFPTDPQALLDYLGAQLLGYDGYEPSEEARQEFAVEEIVSTLRSNFAPATVRQTFLSALELSGLAQAITSNGAVIYSIRFETRGSRTDTVTIDPVTGWVTEYTLRWDRDAGPAAAGDMVPTNIPDIRMTYTVSIVDEIP